MNINSVLNITCSMAKNKESLPVDCNLLTELLSNKYQLQQDAVRNEKDPEKQNTLKMAMPALWLSCSPATSKATWRAHRSRPRPPRKTASPRPARTTRAPSNSRDARCEAL